MQFHVIPRASDRKEADIALLPYWMEGKKMKAAFPKKEFDEGFISLIEKDFTGKAGEFLFSYVVKGVEQKVLLVGLGSLKECTAEFLRKTFAKVSQTCQKKKLERLNLFLPEELSPLLVSSILEGLSMANYSYDVFKKESLKENPKHFLKQVNLIGATKEILL